MSFYIHQHPNWPRFTWDEGSLSKLLGEVRYVQGRVVGRMEALGLSIRSEAMLQTLTQDVLKSTEIEGELLNPEQVRSSIARRLGLDIAGLIPSDRHVEGVVEMMLDATQNYREPLTEERLFGWQASLFPTGRSGMYKVITGAWRAGDEEPMQVVSGPLGREKVHFQAPAASQIESEMNRFLDWFNNKAELDPVLKAGVAHLWFVTIHPFDDGNGRVARAIADMQLARADRGGQRYYSMSAQIRQERSAYYAILEKTQKGTLDITPWLEWFLSCLHGSLSLADEKLEAVLQRARFWDRHAATPLNERQRLLITRLQDGFLGKLTSSKWAKVAKCSQDTAGRDIQDLIRKGILEKEAAGGRSTSYVLVESAST
ncbi:Fic family protein [Pontibacter diazotrophicus]|uniref:Fic family protein n=1 Tax=Pontibacter diazotrophicus TaxID=1400979 RepID=A0A3D8L396_9BACT|nr:Fic family protein [Pontibacter diazotrophicus]RDV11850.1 Fic family protein [Pontibacter diazotrophicus]